MHSERCPICSGKGIVPNGFYSSTESQWSTTNTTSETCRSCSGKGWIEVNDNNWYNMTSTFPLYPTSGTTTMSFTTQQEDNTSGTY